MSPVTATEVPVQESQREYRLIDLGKYVRLLWRRRWILVGGAVAGGAAGWLLAFSLHPLYESTVRLMPPQPASGGLAALTQNRNLGDLYMGLITSRTVQDDVIAHQHLADYFHTTVPTQLRRALGQMASISVDKDQFVTVVVRAREPETAVRVANEFPAALYRLNHQIAVSQANHRWEYVEGPLEQEKNKLAEAEEDLKTAQQQTGVVMPEAQVQLGLSAISLLNQQITSRQEQLAAIETSSTDQNPQVVELKSQIGSLEAQLHRLQSQTTPESNKGSNSALPAKTLEVERKAREVKFHETLFDVLAKEAESAKLTDSYTPSIELVDKGVLADEKSWPSRRGFAEVGLICGLVLSLLLVLVPVLQPLKRFSAFMDEQPERPASGSKT